MENSEIENLYWIKERAYLIIESERFNILFKDDIGEDTIKLIEIISKNNNNLYYLR